MNTDDCGDLFDAYKAVMNNMVIKNDIINAIFQEKKWEQNGIYFAGAFFTFPEEIELQQKLRSFYKDTIDAKPMNTVVKNLSRQIVSMKKRAEYIAFILGAVADTNDVSHHIGFIYGVKEGIIKMFDPGIRSWGPILAGIVVKTVEKILYEIEEPNVKVIRSYSGKWCTLCGMKEIGPQDVCRGGYTDELFVWLSTHRSTFRESYCQTWSLILVLNELEGINEGVINFSDALLEQWNIQSKESLEICIRRFILWIVNKYPDDFENHFRDTELGKKVKMSYKEFMLLCMKTFNVRISVPLPGDRMCSDISLKTEETSKRRRK